MGTRLAGRGRAGRSRLGTLRGAVRGRATGVVFHLDDAPGALVGGSSIQPAMGQATLWAYLPDPEAYCARWRNFAPFCAMALPAKLLAVAVRHKAVSDSASIFSLRHVAALLAELKNLDHISKTRQIDFDD